jgi:hypothetical protein
VESGEITASIQQGFLDEWHCCAIRFLDQIGRTGLRLQVRTQFPPGATHSR